MSEVRKIKGRKVSARASHRTQSDNKDSLFKRRIALRERYTNEVTIRQTCLPNHRIEFRQLYFMFFQNKVFEIF
jgi:hypothetical protein